MITTMISKMTPVLIALRLCQIFRATEWTVAAISFPFLMESESTFRAIAVKFGEVVEISRSGHTLLEDTSIPNLGHITHVGEGKRGFGAASIPKPTLL